MKRFTLSLAIVAMVAGTMTLDAYAGGRGHSNGRSGFSRSSSSRSNFSSRSRGNFQSRNNGMRSRTSTMKAPQKFNHRVTNTRMNQNSFSKMQHKGSSLQPHFDETGSPPVQQQEARQHFYSPNQETVHGQ